MGIGGVTGTRTGTERERERERESHFHFTKLTVHQINKVFVRGERIQLNYIELCVQHVERQTWASVASLGLGELKERDR